MRRRVALTLAFAAVLAAREAYGDEIYHLKSPSTVETQKGSKLALPDRKSTRLNSSHQI